MTYFIVRVNTEDHYTRALAMADMATIIERRGYWKKSVRNDMPVGSPVIAVGSHGGRGVFLHGVVRTGWKDAKGPDYKHKLGMQWDHAVYLHDETAVEAVLGAAGVQGDPPILRSVATMSHERSRDAIV
jgi:hypothetical protein